MSFSRRQQPEWQAMIAAAWAAHCRQEAIEPVPKKWDRSWYERELVFATGKHSTADCNAGRDYDRAMAHFETLAGSSIRWQMKLHTGDAKRLLHELQSVPGGEAITENYLRAVAQQMLRTAERPELERLSREKLIIVLGEVKRHLRRRAHRATASEELDELAENGCSIELQERGAHRVEADQPF